MIEIIIYIYLSGLLLISVLAFSQTPADSAKKAIEDGRKMEKISLTELATAKGIPVVIPSILPVYDYFWKRGLAPAVEISFINQKLKGYARSHRLIYVDYYAVIVDERKE
jgi:hypothetical protein